MMQTSLGVGNDVPETTVTLGAGEFIADDNDSSAMVDNTSLMYNIED
jgi:hypothetical protein